MGDVLKNIEEIENYFEGKLSLEDKLLFEAKLESNPELADELNLYKQIRSAIVEKGNNDLKNKFALADEELDIATIVSINKKTNYKVLAIAASVILVVGVSIFFFLNGKKDYTQLAIKYYEAEKGLPVEMGPTSKFDKLMNLYKLGNYTDAQRELDELFKNNSNNDTLLYFSAVVNDELKDYDSAISGYSKIPNSSTFFQKAQYRLVLTYLKTNEKDKALDVIKQSLENKEHLFYDKLSQLSSELSK